MKEIKKENWEDPQEICLNQTRETFRNYKPLYKMDGKYPYKIYPGKCVYCDHLGLKKRGFKHNKSAPKKIQIWECPKCLRKFSRKKYRKSKTDQWIIDLALYELGGYSGKRASEILKEKYGVEYHKSSILYQRRKGKVKLKSKKVLKKVWVKTHSTRRWGNKIQIQEGYFKLFPIKVPK